MRRALLRMVVTAALVALAGCGEQGGGGDDGGATTTVAPVTTTTSPVVAGDPKGIACLELATEGLKLRNDYIQAQRGIVAPDDDDYRRRGDALRARHAELGCPGDLLRGFPTG
jgi:hypothetical protein